MVGTSSHPSRQATKTKQNQSVESPIHTTIHRPWFIGKQLPIGLPAVVKAAAANPGISTVGLVL